MVGGFNFLLMLLGIFQIFYKNAYNFIIMEKCLLLYGGEMFPYAFVL